MILVALGSSLGFAGRGPAGNIIGALGALARVASLRARSRLYASPAWPDPADPAFVNAVAAIDATLSPEALLAALQAIEAGFGRRRAGPANGPRTLDLDIIDYHGLVRPAGAAPPTLPHPRMEERDFVLAPLAEVAPDWIHPISGRPVRALLAGCRIRGAQPLEGDDSPAAQRNG